MTHRRYMGQPTNEPKTGHLRHDTQKRFMGLPAEIDASLRPRYIRRLRDQFPHAKIEQRPTGVIALARRRKGPGGEIVVTCMHCGKPMTDRIDQVFDTLKNEWAWKIDKSATTKDRENWECRHCAPNVAGQPTSVFQSLLREGNA